MDATDDSLPATIPEVAAAASRRYPQAVALEHRDRRTTFAELHELCSHMAAAFLAYGLRKGERVAIWAPNIPEWIVVAIGAQTAGGVLVPLNTRLKGKEAGHILRKSGARLLFTVGEFLGIRYPQLLANESLPSLEQVVDLAGTHSSPEHGVGDSGEHLSHEQVVGRPDGRPPQETLDRFMARGDSIDADTVAEARDQVGPDDVADIMFTSGTIGEPKGVMSTHGQNIWTFDAWSTAVGLRTGDRYLIVNPFFHTFGYKAGWLACLLRGATIIPVEVFDAGTIMRRVVAERISVLPGPPALFQSMLAHELCGHIDLSSLRLAVTGSANVPPVLVERMRSVLGFQSVLTGYGLTEAPVVTICRHGDSDTRVALTCGAPLPGIEVKCVAEDGGLVNPGGSGEVLVRGRSVMRGYFEDPEATARAIDRDGWLHTGDIGVLDPDGYLRITDRKQDLFICGGFNCYPAEIERIMSAHPAIAQVAVIGVPDERLGEVGKAFVVLRPEATWDSAALISWCRDNMANYKVPRHLEQVAALPTTASGKVQKFALR